MAEDDGELMVRYAGGDLRAFTALYARHRGPLYRYVARLVRDRDAADDLFQEVWSRVIGHRGHYEPRARFSTFLYRVAHNCCIDHLRRAAARPSVHEVGDETACDETEKKAPVLCAPEEDSPDARVERAERLSRYRAALETLPLEQRDVFLLFGQSGLTLAEIAAITGVGTETAKSRLRYAVAKLRSALAAEGTAARAGGIREGGVREGSVRGRMPPVAVPVEGAAAALRLAGESGA